MRNGADVCSHRFLMRADQEEMNKMQVSAILAAGGSGSRMGNRINKVFMPILGKTVIEHTVDVFLKTECIDRVIIVTRKEDMEECKKLFRGKPVVTALGGSTRQESVYNGLKLIDDGIVVIHDAARPIISPELIEECVRQCEMTGAAAAGIPCVDTLKRIDKEGFTVETVAREEIVRIQTPQVFKLDKIKKAHKLAAEDGFSATDDCALFEKYIGRVKVVWGDESNIKVTYPKDLIFAERMLEK